MPDGREGNILLAWAGVYRDTAQLTLLLSVNIRHFHSICVKNKAHTIIKSRCIFHTQCVFALFIAFPAVSGGPLVKMLDRVFINMSWFYYKI